MNELNPIQNSVVKNASFLDKLFWASDYNKRSIDTCFCLEGLTLNDVQHSRLLQYLEGHIYLSFYPTLGARIEGNNWLLNKSTDKYYEIIKASNTDTSNFTNTPLKRNQSFFVSVVHKESSLDIYIRLHHSAGDGLTLCFLANDLLDYTFDYPQKNVQKNITKKETTKSASKTKRNFLSLLQKKKSLRLICKTLPFRSNTKESFSFTVPETYFTTNIPNHSFTPYETSAYMICKTLAELNPNSSEDIIMLTPFRTSLKQFFLLGNYSSAICTRFSKKSYIEQKDKYIIDFTHQLKTERSNNYFKIQKSWKDKIPTSIIKLFLSWFHKSRKVAGYTINYAHLPNICDSLLKKHTDYFEPKIISPIGYSQAFAIVSIHLKGKFHYFLTYNSESIALKDILNFKDKYVENLKGRV